ncbi:NAD-dependent epimerase/dehydratase family protein [Arcticibacter eurypsychrophilus]|uniref:NAD-dependent epimerase/dehydratase family protein n=1 Tax=Arcticibacter eurypsychrophilus TaxID=1434752 RepID=UPI00084CEB12|nr:NAD-dependent epimerase/dehydratase family protein [Arcticibacter eurypsychrophilus]
MKILLTGATGFLGNIILKTLSLYDFSVVVRNHYDTVYTCIICDLSKNVPTLPLVDIVIHAAGKAHSFPKNNAERDEFYNINVSGTRNLLEGLELSGLPKSFVFISTVAVYGCDCGTLIPEDRELLAKDTYGQSKIRAEELIQSWCKKNNVICSILRLPLIAGANPKGNLGSMIRGIKNGYYLDIDGGRAKKSIVLAEDIALIIPKVALIGGVFNLTDGQHPSFIELSSLIAFQLGRSMPYNIPLWVARVIAKLGDLMGKGIPLNSPRLKKITSDLTFDDSKAFKVLGWRPTAVLKGFKI